MLMLPRHGGLSQPTILDLEQKGFDGDHVLLSLAPIHAGNEYWVRTPRTMEICAIPQSLVLLVHSLGSLGLCVPSHGKSKLASILRDMELHEKNASADNAPKLPGVVFEVFSPLLVAHLLAVSRFLCRRPVSAGDVIVLPGVTARRLLRTSASAPNVCTCTTQIMSSPGPPVARSLRRSCVGPCCRRLFRERIPVGQRSVKPHHCFEHRNQLGWAAYERVSVSCIVRHVRNLGRPGVSEHASKGRPMSVSLS